MRRVEKVQYKIMEIHDKILQVVYDNQIATHDDLAFHNELMIHQRHLQFIATEIYKSRKKF